MKLSELTREDKIRMAAELEGFVKLEDKTKTGLWGWLPYKIAIAKDWFYSYWSITNDTCLCRVPQYDQSYDAIIPLIQKLGMEVVLYETIWDKKTTPAQLLDTLLVATGKAEL